MGDFSDIPIPLLRLSWCIKANQIPEGIYVTGPFQTDMTPPYDYDYDYDYVYDYDYDYDYVYD